MQRNLVSDTDGYKPSHFVQLPPGMTSDFSYFESRGGAYPETLWFGHQGLLKAYFQDPVTAQQVERVAKRMKGKTPFPYDGWMRIVNKWGGYLPVRIRAVREGAIVPTHNSLLTIENVDPELPWLVGWLEPKLERLWFPTTVATRSLACKRVIWDFLKKTSDNPAAELPWKLHDFGARGTSSAESAAIGAAAHLVNFMGSDTLVGVEYIEDYYNPSGEIFGTIPAMQHGTVIAWGPKGEEEAFRNMLSANAGYNMVACVSDTYDFYNAVTNIWGGSMREEVEKSGKMVVIRPDSGDPGIVNVNALMILEKAVGMTVNTKGYKVLPPFYRLIQGDGNNSEEDVRYVLETLERAGYSASNIAFGMGGGLLQKMDRDTLRFAYKTSEVVINGESVPTRKVPKTDPSKASKAGRLDLVKFGDEYVTVVGDHPNILSELVMVYDCGCRFNDEPFDVIRARANREFVS